MKPQDLVPGLGRRIERGGFTAERIPHPNSSSAHILISQAQRVAALARLIHQS